jgi:hypothetical protein
VEQVENRAFFAILPFLLGTELWEHTRFSKIQLKHGASAAGGGICTHAFRLVFLWESSSRFNAASFLAGDKRIANLTARSSFSLLCESRFFASGHLGKLLFESLVFFA